LLSLLPEVETIAEAADGRQSVDFVAEYRPDVVLMDMQMPVMDGVEATRQIKEQWPTVRVIALTIHPQYRAKALAAGADVFLLKDSGPEALVGAILNKVDRVP
jgi:DNA-binding NarL/FixJ family response regulator